MNLKDFIVIMAIQTLYYFAIKFDFYNFKMDSFKFLKNFFDLKAYDIDGEIVLK
jgi:hypothetical protein